MAERQRGRRVRLGLAGACVGLVVGCGQQGGTEDQAGTNLPERPDTVGVADGPSDCTFDSLPALVATSDVAVVGTVESARPGPVIRQEPFPSSDPDVQDDTPTDVLVDVRRREVTVRVEEQFFGAPMESKIILEQAGYEGERGIELQSMPWLFPGDRAVFFAQKDADTGHYRIMLAGEWVVETDGTVSTFGTDPILVQVDGKSWAAVAADIRTAVGEVRAGKASPVNVPAPTPTPSGVASNPCRFAHPDRGDGMECAPRSSHLPARHAHRLVSATSGRSVVDACRAGGDLSRRPGRVRPVRPAPRASTEQLPPMGSGVVRTA